MPAKKLSWDMVKNLIENTFKHHSHAKNPTVQQYHHALLENIAKEVEGPLPPLAASTLSLQDIKDVFNIEQTERDLHNVLDSELLTVPPELAQEMRENVEMLARMPKNEAECRLNVNKLFMYCLKEERQALATAPNPRPYLPAFTLETTLHLAVTHKGVRKLLTGVMDYSMFYANDETATGLVILEAKSIGSMSNGRAQCLAYMAMVHCIRKREHHPNAVIHGIVTDSRGFCFLRIDNDSKWCQWQPQIEWGEKSMNEIYTTMRLIIRNAAMSSPRTSTQPVRRISSNNPTMSNPADYHLRVGSEEDQEMEELN